MRFIDRQPRLEPFEIYSWLSNPEYGGYPGRVEIEKRLNEQTPFKEGPEYPDKNQVDFDAMNVFYRLGILERHALIRKGMCPSGFPRDNDAYEKRCRRLMDMMGLITESCADDEKIVSAFLQGVTDFHGVHDQIFEGYPKDYITIP